jgi:hypothetical protein
MSRSNRIRRSAQERAPGTAPEEERLSAPQVRTNTVIRFSLTGFLLFTGTLILVSGVLTFSAARSALSREPARSAVALDEADESGADAAPDVLPPWGELWVREIDLDRPDEYASFEVDPQRPAWFFRGATREQVSSLLIEAHLPSEQLARALGPELSQSGPDGFLIHPDLPLALALTQQDRAQLYRTLGSSAANRYMQDPFRARPGDIDKWFAHWSDPSLVGLLSRLTYPCGKLMCFSDYELLMQQIADAPQRILFAKTLSRKRALMVRLRVRPSTDIDKVLGYWTQGARGKDVRPLLESLQRLPEGGTSSMAYVLPPFARLRLYTFPTAGAGDDPTLNCHWTTLNFFNETPDNRFADPGYMSAYLAEHFFRVGKPSRYGDRVFLIDHAGTVVHSAVYIADDIVFTKNGHGAGQPWMLMRLDDMVDYYSFAEPMTVISYRDKDG